MNTDKVEEIRKMLYAIEDPDKRLETAMKIQKMCEDEFFKNNPLSKLKVHTPDTGVMQGFKRMRDDEIIFT